jgi:hypothetical protein
MDENLFAFFGNNNPKIACETVLIFKIKNFKK